MELARFEDEGTFLAVLETAKGGKKYLEVRIADALAEEMRNNPDRTFTIEVDADRFADALAEVDSSSAGVPSVEITESTAGNRRLLNFNFHNLKGDKGIGVHLREPEEWNDEPSAVNEYPIVEGDMGTETVMGAVRVKNGNSVRITADEGETDENGMRTTTVTAAHSDGTEDAEFKVRDGVGIRELEDIHSVDDDNYHHTLLKFKLTDGTEKEVEMRYIDDSTIKAELEARIAADEALAEAIAAETERATEAEGDLAAAISAEKDRATEAEDDIRERLDFYISNHEEIHADLGDNLDFYISNHEEIHADLGDNIEDLQEDVSDIKGDISSLLSAAGTLQNNINAIDEKIPAQASAENQLADKNFVNSSIQTNTAYYRGDYDTWADVPESADGYPIDSNGNREPTNNDYMTIVDASDWGDGSHTGTWRFKYTGTWSEQGMDGWLPEYEVNGTPMTAAQLAALNSNITAEKVAEIDMKANAEDVDESISTLERTKISRSLKEVPSSFYNKNIDYEILMRETSHTLPACRYNLSQVLDPKADKSTVVEGLPLSLANITHNCRGTVTNTTQEYFVSNNTGVDSSTAKTTLKAKIALSNIQFNYVVRAEIADRLTITVNGTDIVRSYSGGPNGLEEFKGTYSLSTNQTIVLEFVKDGSFHSGADCAMVKIRVSGTEITCDNINDYFTVEHDTSTDYHFIGPVKASPYMTTAVTLPENSVAIDPATNRPYDGSTVNVVFSADFTAYCPKQGNKVFGKNHASGTCMRLSFLATNPSTSASDTYAFPCKNGGEYMGEGCVREGEMVKFVFFEDGANSCWHADGTDIIYKGECSDGHYVKYRGGKIEQMGKSSRYTSNGTFPICFTTVPFVIRQWDNTYDCYVAVGD